MNKIYYSVIDLDFADYDAFFSINCWIIGFTATIYTNYKSDERVSKQIKTSEKTIFKRN